MKLKDDLSRECWIEFEKKGAFQNWKVVKVNKRRPLRFGVDKGTFDFKDNKHERRFFEVLMYMTPIRKILILHGVEISFLHLNIRGRYKGSWSLNNLWEVEEEQVGIWKYRV